MKQTILNAALALAVQCGYQKLTREAIAARAGCSPAQVSRLLGTMAHLRRAVMGEAIKTGCLTVIAQGLAVGDARARSAALSLRQKAARSLE